MKKLLEAELISIAHRILKLKGREDIDALLKEAQLVTQKLTVLKFYEDYKYLVEKDMPQEDFDKEILNFSINSNLEKPVTLASIPNELINDDPEKASLLEEAIIDKTITTGDDVLITGDVDFFENEVDSNIAEPIEENQLEPHLEEANDLQELTEEDRMADNEMIADDNEVSSDTLEENQPLITVEQLDLTIASQDEIPEELVVDLIEESEQSQMIATEDDQKVSHVKAQKLEDLFQDFADFDFVKPDDNKQGSTAESQLETSFSEIGMITDEIEKVDDLSATTEPIFTVDEPETIQAEEVLEAKNFSLNDKLSGGVKIGLNDKIGFVKHLFDGSEEDFTRVVSQLNTFDSHQEAIDFVENMVKPDYNNWENKDDYATRFFGILERSY
jgi:hypothetical protein